MIKKVEGDILLSKAQVIVHGAAPNDDFKTGFSLTLRERWPAMYKDFRHFCQSQHPKPGTLWSWAGTDGVRIVTLFTQDGTIGHHGGRAGPATLPHLGHCLRELRKQVEKEQYKSLALPRIATGVGGLDWKIVEPLLREHLDGLPMPIYVYEVFRPGVAANEA